MTLRLAQTATPRSGSTGDWNWSVWVEGPAEELARFEKAVYLLHPTYPRPRRTSTNVETGFRINSYGWAEFLLRASLVPADGSDPVQLERWIKFRDDGNAPASASKALKKVFLSYSAGDNRAAERAHEALTAAGVTVLTARNIQPGIPWENGLTSMIGESDAVVVLPSEGGSRTVDMEVDAALGLHRSVIPVQIYGEEKQLPDQLVSFQELRLKNLDELGMALTEGTFIDDLADT